MNEQFSEQQAKAFGDGKFWEYMTFRERAEFQIDQDLLCMPFDIFHEAVEKTLGRPVWTHEFADRESIRAEVVGSKQPPTMQEIIEMIPAEKRVIIIAR